ncbi:hypothetical protein, partial [Myceligenerans halotolerans]
MSDIPLTPDSAASRLAHFSSAPGGWFRFRPLWRKQARADALGGLASGWIASTGAISSRLMADGGGAPGRTAPDRAAPGRAAPGRA